MQSNTFPRVINNGEICNLNELPFPIWDYGFLYGYGLFETVLVVKSKPILLKEHLARLRKGAIILDIPFLYSDADIESQIRKVIEENKASDAALNLYLTPGDRGPGSLKINFDNPRFLVVLRPLATTKQQGVEIGVREESFQRIRLDGFKTMSYIKNVLEKRLYQQFDDVVLYNHKGEVLESTVSNVFFVKGDIVMTPKSASILPGIIRNYILSHYQSLGINCLESQILVEDLPEFDEIFLTNSLFGIIPVKRTEKYPNLVSKSVTKTLQKKLNAALGI